SHVPGQNCPGPPDKIDRGQGTGLSGDKGQGCPGAADKIDRGQGTGLSGDKGQGCPQAPDKIDRSHRSGVAEFKESPRDNWSPEGSSSKRSTLLNALKAGGQSKKGTAENIFLLDVAAMMDTW